MRTRTKFTPEHWEKITLRIERTRKNLSSKPSRHELDDAVIDLWICGEYLINVCLETNGRKECTNHTHHKHARDLKALGELESDYYRTLEMLQRFRKIAGYLGYSKSNSDHYNSISLNGCLADIEALFKETERKLKAQDLL